MRQVNSLNWQVGFCDGVDAIPEIFYPATVPGAVQLDYFAANNCEPYWYGENILQYDWMEKKFWLYRTNLSVPDDKVKRTTITFLGLDYQCQIRIDGKTVLENEGMFVPVKIDLTEWAGKDIVLEVLFYPPPKDLTSANPDNAKPRFSCKPAVSYGWDFHPRMIPIGIWDDVILEVVNETAIDDVNLTYKLDDSLENVDITVEVSVTGECDVEVSFIDDADQVVATTIQKCKAGENGIKLNLSQPKLWWPVGHGEQYRYRVKANSIVDGNVTSTCEKLVGFRRSELRMNHGEWQSHVEMPKTRNKPPIALYVNNRPIFAKGSNFVPLDIFYGSVDESRTREMLMLVKNANMNIIRIWGGGVVNKEIFYSICDELGIMVWQEFTLACNEYPNDEKYLSVLEKQAIGIVKRMRLHPSVIMWCGGNELFNAWSKMTDQHHALRLLNKICYEYDQQTPFLPTSPLYGMAHGNYLNVERGGEILTRLVQRRNTAYTEFGSPGPSSAEYIRQFMTEEDFNNLDAPVWKTHHAFGMWMYHDTHLRLEEAQYYFNGWDSTEDLLNKLSLVQQTNYKAFFEEMRCQWPYCSMAINWCFNEPWPTASNNSIVNWPLKPKPSYESVKLALRDQMISLRFAKQRFAVGEKFNGSLWMLNDCINSIAAGLVKVYLVTDDSEKELMTWNFEETSAQCNQEGPGVGFKVPETKSLTFKVKVCVEGHDEMNSEYLFFLDPRSVSAKRAPEKPRMMNT